MTIELRQWDTAQYLQSDEDMMLYLQACFDEAGDDAAYIARAVGDRGPRPWHDATGQNWTLPTRWRYIAAPLASLQHHPFGGTR